MQWDAIWNRARVDLVILTERGDEDLFLWEHSVRVANNARQIAKLSMVRAAFPDEAAVVAAALYHEAGWIARLKAGEIKRDEILLRPLPEIHREKDALILERSMAKLLSPHALTRASQAVRALNDRAMESIEAQVVTEADNLDEVGVLSLWATIRRTALDGKGVQAVIDTWRRRKEYRFWEAWLDDSFRWTPVRTIARKRLKKLERLMEELEEQHQGADLVLDDVVKENAEALKR